MTYEVPFRMISAAILCSLLVACGSEVDGAVSPSAAPDTPSTPATGTTTSTGSTTSGSSTSTGSASTGSTGSTGTTGSAPSSGTTPSTGSTTSTGTTGSTTSTGTTGSTSSLVGAINTTVGAVTAVVNSALQPIAAASAAGLNTLRVRSISDRGAPADSGMFRVNCGYSHMAFDDPIVLPGQPGKSHLHTFFGNTSTDALSTTASLLAAKSSTCNGGVANLTSYWVPAMIDSTNLRALVPSDSIFYYKTGYLVPLSTMKAPPSGLRMVGGNSATRTTPVADWSPNAVYSFECWSDSLPGGRGGFQQTIPACPVGGNVLMMLVFPDCWDGVNLDSPDHRSHMAYSRGTCPSTHPVLLPQVTLNIHYAVTVGQDSTKWRLASDNYTGPGGYSVHGDVWFNWQADIEDTWLNNCLKASKDCHANLLGDGRELF